MSCVHKTNFNSICKLNYFMIITRNKLLNYIQSIFHRIRRNKLRLPISSCLTVSPLCLEGLNVSTITKHDITQIAGCSGCINRTAKSSCISQREISGMVNMRMRQQGKIYIRHRNRHILVLILVRTLFHTTIHEKSLARSF